MSKKEQIELIIDKIREQDSFLRGIEPLLSVDFIEHFAGIYDIGYQIIPIILGINKKNDFYEELQDDLLFAVMNNHMSKKEFFKQIKKYL